MTVSVSWTLTVKREPSGGNHCFFKPFPSPSTLKIQARNHLLLNGWSPSSTACPRAPLTLGSHQDQRNLTRVPVVGHPAVVVVDRLETYLILQAEDKYNSVHPHGKLGRKEGQVSGRNWVRSSQRERKEQHQVTFMSTGRKAGRHPSSQAASAVRCSASLGRHERPSHPRTTHLRWALSPFPPRPRCLQSNTRHSSPRECLPSGPTRPVEGKPHARQSRPGDRHGGRPCSFLFHPKPPKRPPRKPCWTPEMGLFLWVPTARKSSTSRGQLLRQHKRPSCCKDQPPLINSSTLQGNYDSLPEK